MKPDDVEELPDPRDDAAPATMAEVSAKCDALLTWIRDEYLPDPRRIITKRLRTLIDALALLDDAEPVPFSSEAVKAARTVPEMVTLTKRLRQWAVSLLSTAATKTAEGNRKRGRPKKGETGDDAQIISALTAHHEYESGGSIANWKPATGRALSQAANVTQMSVSRFFAKRLKTVIDATKARGTERTPQKCYEVMCSKKEIGKLLALWQGELPDHRHEEYDDERLATGGKRRAGRTPGSHRDE